VLVADPSRPEDPRATGAATAAAPGPVEAMEQALAVRRKVQTCMALLSLSKNRFTRQALCIFESPCLSPSGVRASKSACDVIGYDACLAKSVGLGSAAGFEETKGGPVVPEALHRCITTQVYSSPDSAVTSTDSSFFIITTTTNVLLPCASVDEDLEEVSV